jgi:hypothetical protein
MTGPDEFAQWYIYSRRHGVEQCPEWIQGEIIDYERHIRPKPAKSMAQAVKDIGPYYPRPEEGGEDV